MALIDVFLGANFANTTSWSYSAGWLREIAAFDVLVAFLCYRAVARPRNPELARPLAQGLALLSFLIAANNVHALALTRMAAHAQAALAHAAGFVAGLLVARGATADRDQAQAT